MDASKAVLNRDWSKFRTCVFGFMTVVLLCGVWGCSEEQRAGTGEAAEEKEGRSSVYDKTIIGKSNSLDVLSMVKRRENELLSQSDSTVVSSGMNEDGYGAWFTMVAFDEHRMTAARKYFFVVDENASGGLFRAKKKGLMLSCDLAVPASVRDRPYENENARVTSLLRYVLAAFRADLNDIGEDLTSGSPDTRRLGVSGLMVRSTLEAVLVRIGRSPVIASRLGDGEGLDFYHRNFETGLATMTTSGDVVTVQIELGAPVPRI